jgi:teichuronic acid biosynthesis glycosyltransferase TuaC
MKVLILCSGNAPNGELFNFNVHQAFINEQVESLKRLGVSFDYLFVKGKGYQGYMKYSKTLKKALQNNYDLIHAHNGLCGLIANLQKELPVITTYHGSDINQFSLRMISYFPLIKSEANILVSEEQLKKLFFKKRINVIPCAVDIHAFYPSTMKQPYQVGTRKDILFSSSFSIPIKNYSLAVSALKRLKEQNASLIELKNKSREEVCNLMNSSELLLLTSLSEGSPQVIKEAMACNCPIVSTDVGDIRQVLGNTEGCYLTGFNPADVADKIKMALEFSRTKGRTNGRKRIIELGLDAESIANRIFEVYKKVVNT